MEYRVKWVGHSAATWEPADTIQEDAPEAVNDYTTFVERRSEARVTRSRGQVNLKTMPHRLSIATLVTSRSQTQPPQLRRRDSQPPSAFSCLGGSSRAASTSHQHRSLAGAHTVFAVISGVALLEAKTPSTYHEAMASTERAQWLTAMKSEFDGCVAQETWKLVKRTNLPRGTNIIPVKWVFKIKTDENGVVSKYKARITPKGFKQRHGIDYFEVFASTGKYKTLRVALSVAARHDMELRQLDVPQALRRRHLRKMSTWKCHKDSRPTAWCVNSRNRCMD